MGHPTPIESLDGVMDPFTIPTFEGDEMSVASSERFDEASVADESKYSSKAERKLKDALLSERTSEILSNYRDFLADHDLMDGEELHCYKSRLRSQASESHRNYSRGNSSGSDKATCLLRDFSMPDVELGSNDRSGERKYRLPETVLHSKKAKSCVLTTFGLLAIIAIVIGTSSKGSTSSVPKIGNTPGWHSEAGYILEHEHGDQTARLPHYNGMVQRVEPKLEPTSIEDDVPTSKSEPIVENVIPEFSLDTENDIKAEPAVTQAKAETEEKSMLADTDAEPGTPETGAEAPPTDSNTNSANAAATSGVASFDLSKILHDRFKPLWLSSREGWNGGSHNDAVQYCKNIRGKELCPYSVICPHGPGRGVMAGRRPVDFSSQGEQYAPVYGHDNRWVMVGVKNGDPSTTCKSHEQLESASPSWGLNSEQPEKKMHIMCCNNPSKQ